MSFHKEKWSDVKTKDFISAYLKQTSLWNVSDPEYALKLNKQKAYEVLQNEFNLTLTEVRNKIRIYRTTYAQELKKMSTTNGHIPKLTWFCEMHKAFHEGKVKSFIKTPSKKLKNLKSEPIPSKIFSIEYQEEESADGEHDNSMQYEIKKVDKLDEASQHEDIIIEPYEDDEEYEEDFSLSRTNNHNSTNASTSSLSSGMLSNELFLKSLQSTFDKLPDDKNMRARIKIYEVLYNIMYEVEK